MIRLFFFLVGFGLSLIGLIYIISYLNLLSIGYNFYEYVKFISGRIECLFSVFGIIIMILTIYFGGRKNELYI